MFRLRDLCSRCCCCVCRFSLTKETTIKIEWIGSRSKRKQTYDVKPSMTIGQFKKMIFNNNHGTEFCPITYDMEDDWTYCHNVMLVKSGKILDKDKQTFADYDLTDDKGIPFELSFKICVDGGGKRGRTPIGGNIVFNQQVYDDLARVPDTARAISTTVINDAMLKTFFTQLTDVQLSELVAVWNGKSVNKYKIEATMNMEPSIKFLDQQLGVLENLTDQFKTRFGETFTADAVKDEMTVQIRLREFVATQGHGA